MRLHACVRAGSGGIVDQGIVVLARPTRAADVAEQPPCNFILTLCLRGTSAPNTGAGDFVSVSRAAVAAADRGRKEQLVQVG